MIIKLIMKNKKLFYGILFVVLVIVVVSLFLYLSKSTTPPSPRGQIIVKQSGGAGILPEECANKSYITETADYIIEGTVEKVESKWTEERTSIFTYTDLRIEKYIKGTPFTEDKLQIVTPGGTAEGVGQWVEDQPIFHKGKKVRIYFKEKNGEFSIVCGKMGVEEIIGKAQLPNPASVYCIEQGGRWEIRKDKEGNEWGFCLFEDGSECEEWAFFRNECKKGEKLCQDLCGDGICDEIVCLAIGCPCAETKETCPKDCK
jgi:putative hemolysin